MWPVWGAVVVYSPWWGFYPPLHHLHRITESHGWMRPSGSSSPSCALTPQLNHATSSHRAAGSWFWRTVLQLAKGHRTFKHKLHLQFRFTHQPVFLLFLSGLISNAMGGYLEDWDVGGPCVWGVVQGVSLGCLLGFCSPRVEQFA